MASVTPRTVAAAEAFAVQLMASPASVMEAAAKAALDGFLRVAVDRYHNSDRPLVSDAVYDAVLLAYKRRFPRSDVPLVALPQQDGQRVALPAWMGSLSKLVDDPDALARWRQAHAGAGHHLSDKLDGISGLLEVREAGGGARLMTRGDGTYGRDVSFLMPLMKQFPLPPAPAPGEGPLLVRGELIMSKADFAAIKRGASARNLVNGVVNASRNPDAQVAALVHFVAYELIPASRTAPSLPPTAQLAQVSAWGLPVVQAWALPAEGITQEALTQALLQRQAESPYEVDGVVVAADAPYTRENGKNPTHAFAFKTLAALTEMTSTLLRVDWDVSKDGLLKPTLVFEPVTIGGKKIERATGNNARFVEAHGLGPGMRVRVVLSGAVIPHVLGLAEGQAKGAPQWPAVPWVWDAAHVDARMDPAAAQLTPAKRAMGARQLLHLIETLGIKGLGEKAAPRLYDAGLTTAEALATASAQDLAKIEGFGEKRATAIHAAVAQAVRRADCMTVAVASNAFGHGIGKTKLGAVFRAFPHFAQATPTDEQLQSVDGVGAATAKAILASSHAFAEFLRANPTLGARCAPGAAPAARPAGAAAAAAAAQQPPPTLDLTGKTFVFTGFRSDSLKAYIEAAGGQVVSNVTSKVTAVISKDPASASRSVADAHRLGVRVVTLAEVMDPVTHTILSTRSLTP